MDVVLFACVHAAGRSQLATAWFNRLADPARARAIPAGTQPAGRAHPEVVRVMADSGLGAPVEPPRLLTAELASQATLLITMGCGESCPVVPGLEREDWSLADPKGRPAEEVEAISRDIRARVETLLERRGWRRVTEPQA